MHEPLTVLIVDDHEVVRQGVRLMAESVEGVEVVGEAATGVEALEMCRQLRPKVVLMDVDMPEMDGVEAAGHVRDDMPEVDVLMLTVHEDGETIFDAVRAGARGYLMKSAGLDEVTAALRALQQDGAYMTPLAARKALRFLAHKAEDAEQAARATDVTTPREREILVLLAKGWSAKEVARELGISERTVNTHVAHIYRRLGVRNRVDAVRVGVRLGLVDAP